MVANKKFPHAAFTGLSKSLQYQWGYLQRVLGGIDSHFEPLENTICTKFLPAIFGKDIDDTIWGITSLPTKFAGAGIPNPVTNSSVNYETSTLAVSHLSQAIQGKSDFNLLDHENVCRSTRNAYITKRDDLNEIALSHHLDTLRKDGKEQL